MSLIELMMTLAIASVLVTTATALVTTLSQVKRDSEHVLEVRGNAGSALNLIQFDALNAGYRFASAPFAVRVIPSVSGAEAELAPITAVANCGTDVSWGIMPGSDVLDINQGFDAAEPADILAGTCGGGTCSNVQLSVTRPLGVDPVAGEVVLMSNGVAACMGRVTVSSPPTYSLQLLTQSFTDANGATYPDCLSTLASTDRWKFMKLGRRVRYYVCAPPAAQPNARPALYRRVSNSSGVWSATQEIVQEGVEDLQVAWQVADPTTALGGGTCSGGGVSRICECNGFGGACGAFVPAPTIGGTLTSNPLGPVSDRMAYSIRGLSLGITAINTRIRVQRGSGALETFTRPPLFDHPCDPACVAARSGDIRSTQVVSLVLQNVVMVKP
jgi:Tfp pilus assembly protein PilW